MDTHEHQSEQLRRSFCEAFALTRRRRTAPCHRTDGLFVFTRTTTRQSFASLRKVSSSSSFSSSIGPFFDYEDEDEDDDEDDLAAAPPRWVYSWLYRIVAT